MFFNFTSDLPPHFKRRARPVKVLDINFPEGQLVINRKCSTFDSVLCSLKVHECLRMAITDTGSVSL